MDILLNSGTNAQEVSTNGDSFATEFNPPLNFKGNKKLKLSVKNATLWYTTPNVDTTNNAMRVTVGVTDYDLVFDTGLYSFEAFQTELADQLKNAGANADQITLTASIATQKVIINFNYASTTVDFTVSNACYAILGFEASTYTDSAGESVKAPNVAAFNQIKYYLIHSSICSKGISNNGKYNKIIARINIPKNTSVGSQIIYEPYSPSIIDEKGLLNQDISRIRSWITDQDNTPLNMLSETWSYMLNFDYE